MSKEKKQRNKNSRMSKKLKQFIDDKKKQEQEREEQLIIDGKVQNKIQFQKSLMKIYLQRKVKEELIKYMDELINNNVMVVDGEVKIRHSILEFNGVKQPHTMIESQRELEVFYYKELISSEEYHKSELKKLGFSNKDIIAVMSGKYILEPEKLIKMENDLIQPEIELSKKFSDIMINIQKLKEEQQIASKERSDEIDIEINDLKIQLEKYDLEVQNARKKREQK